MELFPLGEEEGRRERRKGGMEKTLRPTSEAPPGPGLRKQTLCTLCRLNVVHRWVTSDYSFWLWPGLAREAPRHNRRAALPWEMER